MNPAFAYSTHPFLEEDDDQPVGSYATYIQDQDIRGEEQQHNKPCIATNYALLRTLLAFKHAVT